MLFGNYMITALAGIGATTDNVDTKQLIIKAIVAITIAMALGLNKQG